MKIDLSGQVVVVTGGSRGIGAAIARLLSSAGATVWIHYGKNQGAAEAVMQSCEHEASCIRADLSQPGEGSRMIHAILQRHSHIDCLVNNAGVAKAIPLNTEPEKWQAAWQHTLQVNLIAAAEASETVIPHFIARGGGRIIHIASRAAFRGDTPEYAAYAASKGGMVAYSRSIARGYGKQGIKSFVVAPGFTKTDMAQQFMDQYGEDIVKDDLALPEVTLPEDIAPTVLFLASGMMDHATGCSIDINAGSYVR